MKLVEFNRLHVENLILQEKQQHFTDILKDEYYINALLDSPVKWSLIDEEKLTCVCAAGIIDMGWGRGFSWSLMGEESPKNMVLITKLVSRKIEESNFRRVEMTVEDGFEEAHRWAKILGFKCETPNGMDSYLLDKKHFLYSRSK
jgi:hypothetical protein